ncbi:amidohydrolase/deacetylase family metallohydrolase [Polynucleobacter sp. IMCC 30228]|uniref:amidohydrolase/deacetylase family metallohydrolase n=1 Tax=Polynucleobacter sp. IMCC 30228 TaxID=2781011 RepID=UPI001F47F371|nr:amidohydrolase/deacetylase family metallohydrolase [Polynucleobacter sp. IMCC 30228]MCE7527118.1 amidohydrolase/deacetylase family metallohydrolase [Polynucleobacter sp. IMCC 30228]
MMKYDLLLSGGFVIDPRNKINRVCDIGIKNGKIAQVAVGIDRNLATKPIDVSGKLVTPGLIDTHAHVFEYVTGRFGLEADMCGVDSGVTTLIDQGGPSCMTLPAFREYVVKPKKSRIFTYLSSYLVGGMEGHYYPSLYKPDCVDIGASVKSALANPDIVKGFKAHAELGGFARWGIEVIRQAAEIGAQAKLPIYIHFGQLWPLPSEGDNGIDADTILAQVVPLLKAGDILAHPFTRHPGGFVNRNGKVHAIVQEAIAKGLKIDVGHGSHFSYRMAQIALEAGILPDTLGADMHGYNTSVPKSSMAGTPDEHSDKDHMFFGQVKFSLVSAMSAMLALGLPIEHVVAMASWNPQRYFGLPDDIGHLGVGALADISVLNDDRGHFELTDNEGTKIISDRMLTPAFCFRDGIRHEVRSPILPQILAA